ncbi:NPC intracellular cholesterol transporter 2 isoform X2 [Hydra vulgaris]|uniref:NPC intracellular cholesterol transporter 2 isoform X2 n=1 Tax=Hydra vulgaris TaxID=6087 RepID=A0ABM4B7M9_HYDVU
MMTMKTLLAVLFCFFAAVECKSKIKHQNCGHLDSNTIVSITPCDKEPCTLVRGSNATLEIRFKAKYFSEQLKTKVYGKLLFWVPYYSFGKEDSCLDNGITCPVLEDQEYSYSQSLHISKLNPKISIPVKWQIQNEAEKDLVCVIIPLVLK